MTSMKGLDAVSNIKQASVYVDACFILAFLDEADRRSVKVAALLDSWKHREIRLGISSHTFTEVIGVLMANTIMRALQIYREKQSDIASDGLAALTEEEKRDIVSIDAARCIHEIVHTLLRSPKKHYSHERAMVRDILKVGKTKPARRELLGECYTRSVQVFQGFIYSLREHFGIQVEILSSNEKTLHTASQYMTLYQLESYDAVHLALARNQYDFFITLDKDFIQDYKKKDRNLQTKVVFMS
ncbi:PIN domain-containing protein [Ectobacillus ponti]|uniref:PIN domain-containing protein n=1 Tax=Ectobacillus ponti TaxID=2961894 RepID=A0AA42BQM2_9BACI|nr:PIN domain-containing protein [Ectobacillus ponti]MCP8970032.1 PIN domain-containing protein [Ectobacillus ponti]